MYIYIYQCEKSGDIFPISASYSKKEALEAARYDLSHMSEHDRRLSTAWVEGWDCDPDELDLPENASAMDVYNALVDADLTCGETVEVLKEIFEKEDIAE